MPETPSTSDRLDSWKEIAAYLNRNERTVCRWEKRGLPVYRVPGAQRQVVFAYKRELDAWLKHGKDKDEAKESEERGEPSAPITEIPPTVETVTPIVRGFRRKHIVICVLVIGMVSAVIFGLTFRSRASSTPLTVRIGFTATAIQAFDQTGYLIWTHTFSQMLALEPAGDLTTLTNLVRFVDLSGDRRREILVTVPLRMGPNPADGSQNEVDCFSNTGELLWSYVAQEKFRFGNYDLEGPWIVNDVFVSAQGEKPVIWVALDHNRWGNSFVVQLNSATGKDTVRFVNTGVVYKLNEIRVSGTLYLLVAGFNNEYAAGSLAVIDEKKPYAVSPQTDGTRHKCMSCGEGAPDYYFVFPRSEINLLHNLWEDSVHFINVHGEEIEIEKSEFVGLGSDAPTQVGKVHTVYVFHTQPTVLPFSLRFDSSYDLMHRELEKTHKLDHSIEACPERLHPQPIRAWTASVGWKRIDLNPVRAVD